MDERLLRDKMGPIGPHWFAAGEGSSTTIIDTETEVRRTVTGRYEVLVQRGSNTLVNREGRLLLLSGAIETELVELRDEYPKVHTTGRFAVVDEYVVDVEAGKLLGSVPGVPLAVTAAGKVLLAPPLAPRPPEPPDAGLLYTPPSRFPQGPLRWVEPE